jgi:fatty acid desaturase
LSQAWIYWMDLLSCGGIGWASFTVATQQPFGSLGHGVSLVVAVFALLRGLAFLHEIVHHGASLRGFETAWFVLFGIPLAVPSLMYTHTHLDHHRDDRYATRLDPEYAPLASWSTPRLVAFALSGWAVPIALLARWALLTPLTWVIPGIRSWVVRRGSTLAINPEYERPWPDPKGARSWSIQEFAMLVASWGGLAVVAMGALSVRAALQWVFVVGAIFFLNQIRTLAAHRYCRYEQPVSQLEDSVNLANNPLYALIAPLGLRFHALHHWRPGLPYHALGRIHRHYGAQEQSDLAYARSSGVTLGSAIVRLGRS